MFAIGSDYHAQLENYGHAIRILHKPLDATPTPIGWWSWTAYYYGVTQNTVTHQCRWLGRIFCLLGITIALWMRDINMHAGSTPLRMEM